MIRSFSRIAAATLLALSATTTFAYPDKPVAIVVPFTAGGPTDVVARTLAVPLSAALKGTVLVENTVGAGGTVGSGRVARAPGDGHTLLFHHIGMATAPALYRKLDFKPLEDLIPIAMVVDVPMTIVAKPQMEATNLKDLVTYIKANKDKINMANAGIGSSSHLCGLLLQNGLKTDLTTVPFQGTGPALTALLGGQVDLLCDQTTNTTPQIRANKVKAYAVTSASKLSNFPELPTLSTEIPGFQIGVWHILYAPKNTPADVVNKLQAAVQAAVKDPAFVAKVKDLGAEVVPLDKQTSAAAKAHLATEISKWNPIIQAAKVYAD
jgi:tripartite-type tricarboxylate transporter receptor subunit TctC